MTTDKSTETTDGLTTDAREALTDAGQVVMDAYDVGTLFEALLDDLCQHRLTYEENTGDIDKVSLIALFFQVADHAAFPPPPVQIDVATSETCRSVRIPCDA